MEDKNDFIKKNNSYVCSKHNTPYISECPICESERKERIDKSYEKAVKLQGKALKKMSEN